MVIATYPSNPIKLDVIWSQLECFAGAFDKIIISAPNESKETIIKFLQDVNDTMPLIRSRLEAQFHVNDRYDAGLWCDALIEGNVMKPIGAVNGDKFKQKISHMTDVIHNMTGFSSLMIALWL